MHTLYKEYYITLKKNISSIQWIFQNRKRRNEKLSKIKHYEILKLNYNFKHGEHWVSTLFLI